MSSPFIWSWIVLSSITVCNMLRDIYCVAKKHKTFAIGKWGRKRRELPINSNNSPWLFQIYHWMYQIKESPSDTQHYLGMTNENGLMYDLKVNGESVKINKGYLHKMMMQNVRVQIFSKRFLSRFGEITGEVLAPRKSTLEVCYLLYQQLSSVFDTTVICEDTRFG